jgi:hypothetical protein
VADHNEDEAGIDELEDLPAPAPSRDDTRYPRGTGSTGSRIGPGSLRSVAVALLIALSILVPRLIGERDDRPDPGNVAGLEVGPEVREYLAQVETVCRAHNREIRASGKVPTETIVQSEAATTSRIAAIGPPSDAREVRKRLLAARREIDRLAIWQHRAMSRSKRPQRTYRKRVRPVLRRRIPALYRVFASFGIDCSSD